MISAIRLLSPTNPVLVSSAAGPPEGAAGDTGLVPATTPRWNDILSIARPESLPAGALVSEHMSLTVRAKSHCRVMDDGRTRSMSHARLRFRYEFEAADGTRIRIRAEANLRHSQITDGDNQFESTKIRARATISVIQQTVSSGIGSLLDGPQLSPEAQEAISQALDLFQQATEAAASLFTDSNPLDGDGLVAGLVNAFNGLADLIDSIFRPASETPQELPPGEAVQSLKPPAANPVEVRAAEPAPVQTAPVIDDQSETASAAASQEIVQPEAAEIQLVENVTEEATAAPDTEALPAPAQDQAAEPAVGQSSQSAVLSAMYRVRLQVIQSLTNLTGVLDPDSSLLVSQSILRASAHLSARYSLSGRNANTPLSPRHAINLQA